MTGGRERSAVELAAELEPELAPDVATSLPPAHSHLHPPAGAAARLDRRFVTAALMLVMVLASMEQTVTSTAMPTIIGELHGLEHYSWVASIYLLAATVTMPLYGRLADAWGRKKVIVGAIGLFAVGSILASVARTMLQLILFRGMQGLGAGGIMPVVLTILGDIFTLEERARIQGFFSAVWGTASLAGPALGALLVKTLGWRSIFYVNLPAGALGIVVLMWKYRDAEKPHQRGLDLPGAATLALACATALALVSGIGPEGWSWPVSAGLAAVSVAAFAWFFRHARRAADPILPLDVFVDRAIGPSIAGSLLLGAGFLSLDTYVPLYVQGGRGGGVAAAAGAVTPVMLTWACSGVIAAPLIVRWGFRRMAMLGAWLVVLGFSGLVLCTAFSWPHAVLTGVLAITGAGFGPSSMAYLLAAQHAVDWHRRGIVTSGIQFFRTIGGAVGIGLLGALFNVLTAPQLAVLRSQGITPAVLLDAHRQESLPAGALGSARHAIAGGLLWVFVAMLGLAIAQFFVTLMMRDRLPEGGAELSTSASEAMMG